MKFFRNLTLSTSIILICFSFVSCSSNNNNGLNPKNPTQITVWHYYNGAQAIAFDNLVSEFNNTIGSQKGIIVDAISKSSIDDLVEAVTASAQKKVGADDLPNIFQCYLDTAVSLDKLDVMTDLSSYLTDKEKSSYVQGYMEEGILGENNELKLFPIAKSTDLLVLSKNDWEPFAEETGVSKDDLSTWEGIAKTAEKYYTYSNGKSFFGRDAFANYMIIGSIQLGTEIFQVDHGKLTLSLDEEVMRKLWDNYYVPYIKGYYKHIGRFRSDDIKIGEIIAAVGSSTGMSYLPKEVLNEYGSSDPASYIILPVPNFEGTKPFAVQQGANMAVTKSNTTEEYASVEFLKWFTQIENNISFSVNSGYLPVKNEANDIDKVNNFLNESNLPISNVELDSISTAINQVKTSRMYTSNGFLNSSSARDVLNSSMISLAISDREEIIRKIDAGIEEKEAQKEYLTDEYFYEWFYSLKEQLYKICNS